ncbi:glycoprotein L [Cricetid gammaherpesvirus 2]|uniref:Glycoprotein L n=1 Tax=Cricetid gammaherpesvirus 2 TaxID=1605972 RepID=E9M5N0_9GAMA|nr:glycoprotein L [Cricetid gammaherpesvirus 2]ADW24388.1 glycoprotein L [Cricetid gammaherpesvirus 2]ADW24470.1 glycoprotein L [Cricetid gammaherpesvirus 2]
MVLPTSIKMIFKLLIGYGLIEAIIGSFLARPCCHIHHKPKNKDSLDYPFSARSIYFVAPSTCGGTHVATIQHISLKKVKHLECVNGFNLAAFLLAAYANVENKTEGENRMLAHLKSLQVTFDEKLTKSSADTSRFSINASVPLGILSNKKWIGG